MKRSVLALGLVVIMAASANAAIVMTTTHDVAHTGLDGMMSATDLIAGLIPVELPGDLGWHPANTNPADQLPAFTDGVGAISGLTGLLNDNNPNVPVKLVEYDLGSVQPIGEINIFTGNAGQDGRIWSTTVIKYSSDGTNYTTLGYFQSDPSGTLNNGTTGPRLGSTMVNIDDTAGPLMSARYIEFDFYSVDNTGGQMRDPFDGVNPFTSVDDGLTAAFVSPLVYEVDVLPIPEPATLALLGLGGLAIVRRRR